MLSAAELAELLDAAPPSEPLPGVAGVAFHSGRIRPGDAFFALPGEREHGHAYAGAALAAGAALIISDRPHPRGLRVDDPQRALLGLAAHAREALGAPVVAISGSAGKTSTKAFTAAALAAVASPGNLNTPLALACSLIDAWLSGERRPLVLELGIDRRGEMDELLDLVRPSHGVLTLIAESHLSGIGSLAQVAVEKAKLLERSPQRFASVEAAAHLRTPLAGLVRYGLDAAAEVSGEVIDAGVEGQTLRALGVELRLPHPGRAMATNALGALAVARALGVDPALAAPRIAAAQLEPGRLQLREAGGRLLIDDSYNANPASMHAALQVLATAPAPRAAILGDMLELGEEAARLHRELGAATSGLELVIAVGPLARHLLDGNPAALHAATVDDALALLPRLPATGTVLVKASRGMRLERLAQALLRSEVGA